MVRARLSSGTNAVEPQLLVLAGLGALLMGITLGVFGAGGSILTVPILTFLLAYPPVSASHYSLLIVGVVSTAGVALQWTKGSLQLKETAAFALSAMAGMLLVKTVVLPSLPTVISAGTFSVTLNQLILAVFALFMILAAGSMIFVKVKDERRSTRRGARENILFFVTGFFTGGVSGFVGAGGGFLIVPALVFLGGLPVKEASRASLFIIALNSLWGFVVGTRNWAEIPFPPLLLVIAFALVGMFLGIWIQERIQAGKLKTAFGSFVLVMGIYILIRSGR